MEKKQFKNIPTKKFYDFLQEKVNNRELSHKEIADIFQVYPKNPSGFLYELTQGKVSVKLEYILLAEEHFGLNPCHLFKSERKRIEYRTENELSALNEDEAVYETNVSKLIETIRSQERVIESLVLKKDTA